MLAAQGQEGHTSPYALDCSTSLAGSTSTSYCNLSTAPRTTEGQTSVSLTARSPKARKQPWLLQINTNRASVPFFLTGIQKESHPWSCFQRKRKSIVLTKFRRWAKEGEMAPWLQHPHWQWCSAGKDTSNIFFFQRVIKCVCVVIDIHTHS